MRFLKIYSYQPSEINGSIFGLNQLEYFSTLHILNSYNLKNKTINIHTGIRIVKYLNSVQLILRMEIVQNNGSGLFFYLEKYGRLFNRLSRGRLMKLMAIILPRSGRIKGRTPTASA